MGTSPAQAFLAQLANAIMGGCGYPCETGDLAALIWTTVGNNLYAVASQLGMISQSQFLDGINVARIAGTRHLLYLQSQGDTLAMPSMAGMLNTLNALKAEASSIPATAPTPYDPTQAINLMAGKSTPVGNQQALRAAKALTLRFLAVAPGDFQAFLGTQV